LIIYGLKKCKIMCTKRIHKTTWGAAAHIISLVKQGIVKKGVKKLGSYWCEGCQGYHITSKVGKNCIFYKKIENVTGEYKETIRQ